MCGAGVQVLAKAKERPDLLADGAQRGVQAGQPGGARQALHALAQQLRVVLHLRTGR